MPSNNSSPSQQHKKPRILFLRSYGKANVAAILANGLRHCRSLDFWQYPPWPPDRKKKLEKLPHTEEAWESLHINLIYDFAELSQKISSGYFDLVLLTDYDAQLFEFQHMGLLRKINAHLHVLRNMYHHGRANALALYAFLRALPLSMQAIRAGAPIAAVDLSDPLFLTHRDQYILQESSFYFKRELPYDRFFLYYQKRPAPWVVRRKELLPILEKVHNIPLGIEDSKYASLKTRRSATQDIDVLFLGEVTNTLRQTGIERLREFAAKSRWKIVIRQGVSFDEYCSMIARSKITISIAGGGWDCFRHYEAVALGSLPLINKPTIDAVWWHPMPQEIFFENSFNDFTSKIEQLLADDTLRQHCFEQLEQQVEEHMLHSKIVEYIVNTSLQKLSPPKKPLSTNM